jgi:hypothetical protein
MGVLTELTDPSMRRMIQSMTQRIADENPLQSLTRAERQEDTLPITRDPKPCAAWVRFGPHAMRVDAVVVVWNDVACGILFTVGEEELRCWVWANTVAPRA